MKNARFASLCIPHNLPRAFGQETPPTRNPAHNRHTGCQEDQVLLGFAMCAIDRRVSGTVASLARGCDDEKLILTRDSGFTSDSAMMRPASGPDMAKSQANRFAMPASDQAARHTRPGRGRPQWQPTKAAQQRCQIPRDRAVLSRTACCG
jgi:hypothetical protein